MSYFALAINFLPRGNSMLIKIIKKFCTRPIYTTTKKYYRFILFIIDFFQKKNSLKNGRFQCDWKDCHPCLADNTSTTGFDPHYIYHIAWAIRQIKHFSPRKHIDISSSLYFVTALSAYIPTEFYDYRPAKIQLSNLEARKANLTSLDFDSNSIESLSCMHVIEHIGLGRYGDPFDPQGDLKAISELKRVVKPGGRPFIVVPMGGVARVQYNAHRIYSYKLFTSYFNDFIIKNFSFITDSGDFIEFASPDDISNQRYGCGCFELQKWFVEDK